MRTCTLALSIVLMVGLLGAPSARAQEKSNVTGAIKVIQRATDSGNCLGPKRQSVNWWRTQLGNTAETAGADLAATMHAHVVRYCSHHPQTVSEVKRLLGFFDNVATSYTPAQPMPLVMPAGSPPVQQLYAQPPQAPSFQQQAQPYPGQSPVLDQDMLSVYIQCLNTGRSQQPYSAQQVVSILQAQLNQSQAQPPKTLQDVLSEQVASRCSGPVRMPFAAGPPINVNAQGGNVQTGPQTTNVGVGGATQVASQQVQANPHMVQGQSQGQMQGQDQMPEVEMIPANTDISYGRAFWYTAGPVLRFTFDVTYGQCKLSGDMTCGKMSVPRDSLNFNARLAVRVPRTALYVATGFAARILSPDAELIPADKRMGVTAEALFFYDALAYYTLFERLEGMPPVTLGAGYRRVLVPGPEFDPRPDRFVFEAVLGPFTKYSPRADFFALVFGIETASRSLGGEQDKQPGGLLNPYWTWMLGLRFFKRGPF